MTTPDRKKNARKHAASPSDGGALSILLLVAIIVATCFAFSNSFLGSFVFDDEGAVINNGNITSLSPISKFFARNSPRPFVDLSLAISYAMGGLKSPPIAYHAFNLAVHVLAACLIFDIVRRTLLRIGPSNDPQRAAPLVAFAITLLWAVHPLHTQAVTYIVQRSEAMMSVCFLLVLYAAIMGHDSKKPWGWYTLGIVACLIGMGTKVVIVAAPIVVLAYDYLYLSANLRDVLKRRGAYYGALLLTIVAALFWTGLGNSILNPAPGYEVSVGLGIKGATPFEYLATQAGVILYYLRLSVWPASLCADYTWPTTRAIGEAALTGLPHLVALGITALGLVRRKPWAFIGVWFYGVLAPSSSFIPVKDYVVEHRMHLPLAAVVALIFFACRWAMIRFAFVKPGARAFVGGIVILVVTTALAARTIARNRDYYTPQTFWYDIVTKQPLNARAWMNYGESLTRLNKMSEAIECYKRSSSLTPESADSFYNLGNAFQKIGAYRDAEKAYQDALRLDPKDLNSYIMLGNVYMTQEMVDHAEQQFRAAISAAGPATDPLTTAKAHFNLGNTMAKKGRLSEALIEYQNAVRLAPNYEKGLYGLAWCLENLGRRPEAVELYQRCLQLNPQNADAQRQLELMQRAIDAEGQADRTAKQKPKP
ncbi:MAG: tetratricopeptide repeat protein [Planctomycetes bacterium]|nr:tetratricopeptide repeat protein [Planctomycetota bacterium]